MNERDWAVAIREQRRQKEAYFADDPHSPVPEDQFAGLAFFDPDPDYRFELDLREHDQKETITVETSTEGAREYVRHGEFRFQVDGKGCTLQAYKSDGDRLWVPFRDETSGTETYGVGRYLDLEPADRTADGLWVVDFNQAYNPTCAYNEAYECPLVPTENWLSVRIEAGERAYPGDPVGPDH